MLEKLKTNPAIQSVLCFFASMLCGLGAARYLAPAGLALVTFSGSAVMGVVLSWLVYRAGSANKATSSDLKEQGRGSSSAEKSADYKSVELSTANVLLVIDVLPIGQAGPQSLSFLESVQREIEQHPTCPAYRVHEVHRGGLPVPSRSWLVRNANNAIAAEYIELPLQLGPEGAGPSQNSQSAIADALRNLGLAGKRAKRADRFKTLKTGEAPLHPNLKGVLLHCPAKAILSDASLSSRLGPELASLTWELQAKIPFYLVIDLDGLEGKIEGFNDFARNLLSSDAGATLRPVGCAFSSAIRSPGEIEDRLNDVFQRLRLLRCSVLKGNRDDSDEQMAHAQETEKRVLASASAMQAASIFEFPRNLGLYSSRIASSCWNLLKAGSESNHGLLLRGVFFAGTVYLQASSQTVDQRVAQVRRAFSSELVTETLPANALKDASLSGDRLRAYRELLRRSRRRWLLAFESLSILGAFALTGLLVSGVMNTFSVMHARTLASDLRTCMAERQPCIAALDRVQQEVEARFSWLSLLGRFGLYQGNRIHAELSSVYYAGAAELVVNHALAPLEDKLTGSPIVPELGAADALQLYQILHRRPHCDVDPGLMTAWGPRLWAINAGVQPNSEIKKQFNFLADASRYQQVPVDRLRPWKSDIVDQAQRRITNAPSATDAYAEILRANAGTVSIGEVLDDEPNRVDPLLRDHSAALSDATGKEGAPTTVDAAYSITKYAAIRSALTASQQRPQSASCISLSAGAGQSLPANALSTYMADYKKAWKTFLENTKVRPFTLQEGVTRLGILAGDRSPLLAILAFVSHNTAFSPAAGDSNQESVSHIFEPVRVVALPGAERWAGGWWGEKYKKPLIDLRDALSSFADRSSDPMARQRVVDSSSEGIKAVDLLSLPSGTDGVDELVKNLLKSPFELAKKALPPEGPRELDGMLNGFCSEIRQLRGRFPLKQTAPQDKPITDTDLRLIFDPINGSFLQFAKRGFVQRASDTSWQSVPQAGNAELEPRFLAYLNAASDMSRYLFGGGFEFSVEVTPTPADMQFGLEIGGSVRHDTTSSGRNVFSFKWPGVDPSSGVRLSPPDSQYVYPGILGLYVMIMNNGYDASTGRVLLSKLTIPGGGALQLMHQGKPATVDLVFHDLPDNFVIGVFGGLGCPSAAVRR